MDIGEALRAAILADGTLSGLVGSRVYADTMPQSPTLPAVVWYQVSGVVHKELTGSGDLESARIQIDVHATTRPQANSIARQIQSLLASIQQTTVEGLWIDGVAIASGIRHDQVDPLDGSDSFTRLASFDVLADWHPTLLGAGLSYVLEAAADGKTYGRKDRSWVEIVVTGVAEAASDGVLYGRKNGAWVSADLLDATIADQGVSGKRIPGVSASGATIFQAAYVQSDGKFELARANSAATMPALGLAIAAIVAAASGQWLLYGLARNDSWTWTPGGALYMSETTAGALTQARPDGTGEQVQIVGYAITATLILWAPNVTIVEIA